MRALRGPTIPTRCSFLEPDCDQLTGPSLHVGGRGELIQEGSETPERWQKGPREVWKFPWPQSCRSCVPKLARPLTCFCLKGRCRNQDSRTSCQLPRKELGDMCSLVTQCCHRPGSRPHGCQEPGWGGQPAPSQGQQAAPLCWGWTLVYRTQDTSPGSPASFSLRAVKRHHK